MSVDHDEKASELVEKARAAIFGNFHVMTLLIEKLYKMLRFNLGLDGQKGKSPC